MNIEHIFIILVILIIVIGIVIHESKLIKNEKKYQRRIDSIMIGDIFELKIVDELRENPFYDEKESSKYRCVITDIKENLNGEKWVKFRNNDGVELTKEIHEFADRRKRIGNININI
jgi:uncharacterized membrane protein